MKITAKGALFMSWKNKGERFEGGDYGLEYGLLKNETDDESEKGKAVREAKDFYPEIDRFRMQVFAFPIDLILICLYFLVGGNEAFFVPYCFAVMIFSYGACEFLRTRLVKRRVEKQGFSVSEEELANSDHLGMSQDEIAVEAAAERIMRKRAFILWLAAFVVFVAVGIVVRLAVSPEAYGNSEGFVFDVLRFIASDGFYELSFLLAICSALTGVCVVLTDVTVRGKRKREFVFFVVSAVVFGTASAVVRFAVPPEAYENAEGLVPAVLRFIASDYFLKLSLAFIVVAAIAGFRLVSMRKGEDKD